MSLWCLLTPYILGGVSPWLRGEFDALYDVLFPCVFQVVSHRDYKSREDFDDAVSAALETAGVEIVCLAGFMRILSGK